MAATAIRTLTVRFIVNSVKVMKRLYALVNCFNILWEFLS